MTSGWRCLQASPRPAWCPASRAWPNPSPRPDPPPFWVPPFLCTGPGELVVTRVRGTKNPDLAAIAAPKPDLVVANKEANRRLDVERLRPDGIAVWVTEIEIVDQALLSLRRLITEALARPASPGLDAAVAQWDDPEPNGPRARRGADPAQPLDGHRQPHPHRRSPRPPRPPERACRLTGPLPARERRCHHHHPTRLRLLPDEPYPFTADDGSEAVRGLRCALVEGRALTWDGHRPGHAGACESVRNPREGRHRPGSVSLAVQACRIPGRIPSAWNQRAVPWMLPPPNTWL